MTEKALAEPAKNRAVRAIDIYRDFVVEITKRLNAVSDSISELKANPKHPNAWQNCDFCWLQIRKICEYLTIGIVAAHHFDGAAIADLHKWRPKELLAQVSKLNDHPTPVLISSSFGNGVDGERQIMPLARPIKPGAISAVYGRCSDLFHLGSLERILSDKLPAYEIAQLDRWLSAFQKLSANHALFLPGIRKVMVCRTEDNEQSFFALESDGAIFDTSELSEFEI